MPIKLALKKSFNNWVDMGDGVSFLLDYPTREQEQKLDDLKYGEITNVELLREGSATKTKDSLKFMRFYIKCTVKDWKGIDTPFRLNGFNELDDELWWALVKEELQAMKIFSVINKELEFTETDKKK